jgi:hypothetical protein
MGIRDKIVMFKDEIKDRNDKCGRCKFFVPETQTCGKARWKGPGEEVTYRKKTFRLCGCVMPIKTAIPWATCPLGKWGVSEQLGDPEYVKELIDRADRVVSHRTGSKEWKAEVSAIYSELQGEQVRSNCQPCLNRYVEDLQRLVREYRKC